MFATHMYIILWSMVILEVTLALPVNATSGDIGSKLLYELELRILSVTSTSVTVQWNCLAAHNLSLTWKGMIRNLVEKWKREDTKTLDVCQNFSTIGQEVNFTINDLEEGVEYYLMITDGFNMGSKLLRTLTSAPSGPPIYLRARPVNPATIHISWTRPKLFDCNGDILQYIIMVDSGSDEHNYTFNVTNGCVSRTSTKIRCLFHHFDIPESELVPHKNYAVKVAAVNANGTGPFSSAITVLSGDSEAGPPQNLKVTHSADDAPDEFTLQWDMPKNPNGVILGYEIEYGVVNDTNITSNYTDSMNYMLKLSSNETYTITVYAKNSAGMGSGAEIQWPLSDDSSSSKKLKNHANIIIGCCLGAFGLILLACIIIVCVRLKYKKYSNKISNKFYPAPMDDRGTSTVVVNPHYIFAENDPPNNTLHYDYPYTAVNGAQALSRVAFHPQGSTKSSNRNSTSTCGYIEMPVLMKLNPKPRSASFAAPSRSSSNASEQLSTVSSTLNPTSSQLQKPESSIPSSSIGTHSYIEMLVPINNHSKPTIIMPKASSNLSAQPSTLQRSRKRTSRNSTSTCGYIVASINDTSKPHPASYSVPNSPSTILESGTSSSEYQNDIRSMLPPPADGTGVNAKANTNIDNGYVTIRN